MTQRHLAFNQARSLVKQGLKLGTASAAALYLSSCQVGALQNWETVADHPFFTMQSAQSLEASLEAEAITEITPQALAQQWVVSPAEAKGLIGQGATLLDARTARLQQQGMLQGSIAVSWRQFSQTSRSEQGMLLRDQAQLSQALQELGVSPDKPVVVVADPNRGWGEDGRIVWMLRTLGHSQAAMVDGGYEALVAAGMPTERFVRYKAIRPGNFVASRTATWEITQSELQQDLGKAETVMIDVREAREFKGATPYGEPRSGHIPGAVHLYYRDLLDENGRILPRQVILAKLQAQGISPNAQIIAYCTAGVRAGWFTTVLTNAGLRAKNYAGSMLEWADSPAETYPLVTGDR